MVVVQRDLGQPIQLARLAALAVVVGLLIGLLVVAVLVVVGLIRRSRQGGQAAGGMAYQGAGAAQPVTPRQYNATKIGNDASARPWEAQGAQFDPGLRDIGVGLGGPNAKDFSFMYIIGPNGEIIELNTDEDDNFGHIHFYSKQPFTTSGW